jgi:small subunit ribosomal protein S11
MAEEEISEEVSGATEEVVVSAPEKVEAAPVEVRKEKERPRTAEDIFLEMEGAEGAEKPKIIKAKGSKNVHTGVVHVAATFNNTIVSVTDQSGNVIGWSSSGKMGFRGSRKSTAYAAQLVAQDACRQAMAHGLKQAEVRVKGPGAGRESAVRAVQGLGIDVLKIADVTPVPHNGCRPKKARRV